MPLLCPWHSQLEANFMNFRANARHARARYQAHTKALRRSRCPGDFSSNNRTRACVVKYYRTNIAVTVYLVAAQAPSILQHDPTACIQRRTRLRCENDLATAPHSFLETAQAPTCLRRSAGAGPKSGLISLQHRKTRKELLMFAS